MIGIIQQEATIMSVIVKDLRAVRDFLEAMIILEFAMQKKSITIKSKNIKNLLELLSKARVV
jgi:hypothetical protein